MVAFFFTPVRGKQLAVLFRQMSAMCGAGMSLGEVLHYLRTTSSSLVLRRVLAELDDGLARGRRMSEGMAAMRTVFPPMTIALTRVGEDTGRLDGFLAAVADHLEQRNRIASRINGALLYPAFVLVAALFILPLPGLFLNPPGARLHHYFSHNLYPLILVFLLYRLFKMARPHLAAAGLVARGWEWLVVNLPVIGSIVVNLALVRFFRTFAATYAAGVHLEEILQLSFESLANGVLRRRMEKVRISLARGRGIAAGLGATGLLEPFMGQLLVAGETTGRLDESMNRIAGLLETDTMTSVEHATVMLGPVVYLMVAAGLAFKVISFYHSYFGSI
ncbi:type II secretion system F family protein, partial [bacterium]|nr:type II secretion system F family protein [candidate division CSSED10-310 bacterium]